MSVELIRPRIRARGKRKLRPPDRCPDCEAPMAAELRTRTLSGRRVRVYALCPACGGEVRVGIVSF